MANQFQPLMIRVNQGGSLITRTTAELPGGANFTRKLNVRHDIDALITREGDLLFAPNEDIATGAQPYPNAPDTDEPITFIGELRQPNGRQCLLAATPTTIYRFYALENGAVYEVGVYEPGVYADTVGEWLVIGSGFSTAGHRWEFAATNGYGVFNNGVDLPVVYRVEWFAVRPLSELREAGIAAVGTICEHNGILVCGDISEILSTQLHNVLNGTDPYGPITDGSLYSRIQYKLIWAGFGEPTRWRAQNTGTATAGSDIFTVDHPMASMHNFDQIIINGAGENGGNLTTRIQFISPDGLTWNLVDLALTSVTLTPVSKADGATLLVGSYNLQDDASAILRMISLKDRLVIFKDTSIFLGSYTGDPLNPFTFNRVYLGPKTIFWRWTAIAVRDSYVLYASHDSWLAFDLSTQIPIEHKELTLCDNLFFSRVTPANMEMVFTCDNRITSEIWIGMPVGGEDSLICYDYKADKCSTTDRTVSSGATVKRPMTGIQTGPQDEWFVMGLSDGTILQYGKTNTGLEIYSRGLPPNPGTTSVLTDLINNDPITVPAGHTLIVPNGWINNATVIVNGLLIVGTFEAIEAELVSGYVAFDDDLNEHDVIEFAPHVGSNIQPSPSIQVSLDQFRNPAETPIAIGSASVDHPDQENAIPFFARSHYIRDSLVWAGKVRLVGRSYLHKAVLSQQAIRVDQP